MNKIIHPQILLVNQYCGFLCRDMANGLAKVFGPLQLITGNPEGNLFGPNVSVLKGIPYSRKNLWTRLYTWSIFTLQCYFGHKGNSAKAWVLVTNPPFIPLLFGLMAQKRKIPYFLVIYDLYPDALYEVNLLGLKASLFKLWEKANKMVFSKASAIITLSEEMKNSILKYLPNHSPDILVVPNWYEEIETEGIENLNNPFLDRWNGKIVLLYAGNFGLTHDLETIVQAAQILRENQNIYFVFAGNGAKKQRLMQMSKDFDLPNVDFLDYQSFSNFQFLLQAADIGIVSLGQGIENISVPSKTYTAMAAGLVLLGISSKDSALEKLVNTYAVGLNVAPNNPNILAETIYNLCLNSELIKKFKNASIEASKNFTVKNLDKYIEIIKNKIL